MRKLEKSIFEYFPNWILYRKKAAAKTKTCQKLEKPMFEDFLNWILKGFALD